jgi:hypothetical protein
MLQREMSPRFRQRNEQCMQDSGVERQHHPWRDAAMGAPPRRIRHTSYGVQDRGRTIKARVSKPGKRWQKISVISVISSLLALELGKRDCSTEYAKSWKERHSARTARITCLNTKRTPAPARAAYLQSDSSSPTSKLVAILRSTVAAVVSHVEVSKQENPRYA